MKEPRGAGRVFFVFVSETNAGREGGLSMRQERDYVLITMLRGRRRREREKERENELSHISKKISSFLVKTQRLSLSPTLRRPLLTR